MMTQRRINTPSAEKTDQPGEVIKNKKSPTNACSGDVTLANESESTKRRKRGGITTTACDQCRRKKSKCDGSRPICGRCKRAGLECAFAVSEEGVTRMQSLRRKHEDTLAGMARTQILLDALQSGTDHEASSLLARLRMGENIESLIAVINQTKSTRLDGFKFQPKLINAGLENENTGHGPCESLEQQTVMAPESMPFPRIPAPDTHITINEEEHTELRTHASSIDSMTPQYWSDAELVNTRDSAIDQLPQEFRPMGTHFYNPMLQFAGNTHPIQHLLSTE